MDPNTLFWLEVAKLSVTALVTLAVGFLTWRIQSSQRDIAASQRDIAKQQADTSLAAKRVAAAKLNLDLFEERYKVFLNVWTYLSNAFQGNDPSDDPRHGYFTNDIPKSQFLFGEEIATYMRDLVQRRIKLDSLNRRAMSGAARRLTEQEERELRELQQWFADEIATFSKRFNRYLDFSAWHAEGVMNRPGFRGGPLV